ncbi:MAG: hypothetical protein AAF891_06355 [Pseudomonadota bacterium]
MTHLTKNPLIVADVLALVTPEFTRAKSLLDLKHRLARIGYGYSETPDGPMLTTLPHGVTIAPLPSAHFA